MDSNLKNGLALAGVVALGVIAIKSMDKIKESSYKRIEKEEEKKSNFTCHGELSDVNNCSGWQLKNCLKSPDCWVGSVANFKKPKILNKHITRAVPSNLRRNKYPKKVSVDITPQISMSSPYWWR